VAPIPVEEEEKERKATPNSEKQRRLGSGNSIGNMDAR